MSHGKAGADVASDMRAMVLERVGAPWVLEP